MTVWYTSDHHIGHPFVASLRYHTKFQLRDAQIGSTLPVCQTFTDWHDEMLAACWDEVVKPDDTVYVLGDTSVGRNRVVPAMYWFAARNGTKHLIWGNHDEGHPMHSKSHLWQEHYRTAFTSVDSMGSRKIRMEDGTTKTVYLSHFPYEGDHYDGDRFEPFRMRDMGVPLLHGHTHTNQKHSMTAQGTLQIHVGVDAWDFYPVHEETVRDRIG